ncbi:GAF domain-containing protein [Caenimonas koreensis]|nr:GAF domain-containing protein [Caenimonas koreensis]
MKSAPLPANEPERLQAVRASYCAYAPREERFDRITRTLQRLLHVPIAMVTIVEEDEQWFRSVQGLDVDHTARDISFCGHAVAMRRPLVIKDTWEDPDFLDNPLVTGPPGIRSYIGWPLQIAPQLFAGTLCAIDTIPRTFSRAEMEGIIDLARIAESELRASAASSLQKTMLMNLDMVQRRHALDPVTGCWRPRAFRKLLAMGVEQARAEGSQLALVQLRCTGLEDAVIALHASNPDIPLAVLAQLLRSRMPAEAILTHMTGSVFSALYNAPSVWYLEEMLRPLLEKTATATMPDGVTLTFGIEPAMVRLSELSPQADAAAMWAACVSQAA